MSEQITPNPSVPSQVVQEVKFPQFVNNLGIIPTSYKDSMSYYECLAWLCKYLEETVIPTVNENGDAVEELQGLYVELNSYVTNYFETLDVQQEINNKLDAFVEDGTLYSLIRPYLDNEIYPIIETQNNNIENQNARINSFVTSTQTTINTQNTEINTLKSRMDQFSHLTEGSTTGDAELADARIGYDGITYPNVGDAIRGQIGNLTESIENTDDEITIETDYQTSCVFENEGYMQSNGTVGSGSSFRYCAIEVNPMETYHIQGYSTMAQKLYVFIPTIGDTNEYYPSETPASYTYYDVQFTPKTEGILYVNTPFQFSGSLGLTKCKKVVKSISINENEIAKELKNIHQKRIKLKPNWINGYFISFPNLTPTTLSGWSYCKFEVKEGENYHISGLSSYNALMYMLTDTNNKFIATCPTIQSQGPNAYEDTIVIPEDGYLYISSNNNNETSIELLIGNETSSEKIEFQNVNVTWLNDRYMQTNATEISTSGFAYADVPVEEDDILMISGISQLNERLILMFDLSNNLIYSYPNASGSLVYHNEIYIKIPSNCNKLYINGKTVSYSMIKKLTSNYKEISGLERKSLYAFGDSIVHGNTANYSVIDYLSQSYDIYSQKFAVNGAKVSNGGVLSQVTSAPSAIPDYVIFNGLVNDAYSDTTIGEISSSYDPDNFVANTFCGEFEKLCYNLKTKYKGSQILYLICHNMMNRDFTIQKTLYELACQMCLKWSIPTIDLYKEGGLNTWLDDYVSPYTVEGCHPTEQGYKKFYLPLCYNKLKEFTA